MDWEVRWAVARKVVVKEKKRANPKDEKRP
jgi:hypothetical protein